MFALIANKSGWSVLSTHVFKEAAREARQAIKLEYPLGCCRIIPCTSTVDAMNQVDKLNKLNKK